ncbi:MAG: TetR family transcriptional regulator [Frondihabitans sp.]|nr:TetR family transcriptional regulator [Frondihabitans sp.]
MTVEFPPSAVQRSLGASVSFASSISGSDAPLNRPGPGAKLRVLVTADRLFYDEGIRTVGVDRLIAESSVTKATFYKHFGAKDKLVLDYINRRHDEAVTRMEAIRQASDSALDALRGIVAAIVDEIQAPGFRGCPFINAAAEFADPDHPVRVIVVSHRDWYSDTLVELFREAGNPMAGDAADEFLLARDGAMVGGYAGDAIAATAALQRIADDLFTATTQA